MKCEELLAALNEYLDGETQSALCQSLREHLADCATCRVVVDNLRQTITLYRSGKAIAMPPRLHETLCSVMRRRWAAKFPATVTIPNGKETKNDH